MRLLYAGYEGCPVATEYIGYMGTIDGHWYLTVGDDHLLCNTRNLYRHFK